MFFQQTLRMCLKNITSNKLRSFLTMLGVIIGISSVIILVGFTQGTSEDINSSLENLGANVLTVNIFNEDDATLTYSDIKDETFNMFETVLPVSESRVYAKNKSTGSSYKLIGTTPDYLSVHKLTLNDGRNLSDLDTDNSSNIALIGSDVASTLFENENPVGNKILVSSNYYTVVGVLDSGSTSDSDIDSAILTPITTFAKTTKDTSISTIYFVGQEDPKDTNMIERMVSNQLGKIISTDNIEIVTQDTVSSTVSEIDTMTSLLIGLIGAISLIVSGIGVMNIMIISVSERTREIGVRKAIGATDLDILKQFLIEAVLLTSFGGIIGVAIGYLFDFISSWLGLSFVMNTSVVGISLGFSILIGIIFGIIPAIRASKLKPINALKHE